MYTHLTLASSLSLVLFRFEMLVTAAVPLLVLVEAEVAAADDDNNEVEGSEGRSFDTFGASFLRIYRAYHTSTIQLFKFLLAL